MADDFNASLVISTAETVTGLRAVDTASKDLDGTLRALDKTIRESQGNLDAVAKSMSNIVRANAALVKAETSSARAQQATLKTEGERINNLNKLQKGLNDTAVAEAKVQKIQQQKVASGLSSVATTSRRDAEARARMDNNAAMSAARLATETVRSQTANENYANSVARREGAESRAAIAALRLEQAQRKAAQGTSDLTDSLSNSRYLLYDVGQTYTVLSAALLAVPVATATTAIAYQKDFAQVIRTNADLEKSGTTTFRELRQELKSLSREIPLTFGEFSKIASTAGQLGIAGDDVGAFTETVARFGAASNVSLDEASTAFGRLQNSFDQGRNIPDFFNRIGSSIAYVGVRSAASESEIIAVTNQISAAGSQFGFTADQVVGLSGALASVRIRPELARGAFQRIMLQLSRAADQGAASFDKFGKYTGLAADESLALFQADPSAFFYKYIGGLKGVIDSGTSVSSVLDDIGAKNVFDKQFILGLANGYEVYGQAIGDANKAFSEGTFLADSTGQVFETVDAKLKRIGNSIQNLMDSIAQSNVGSNGGLAKVADTILAVVNATDRLVSTSQGFAGFIQLLLSLGGVVGVLLAFKAAQAFVLAGLVGFQQVLGRTSIAAGLTLKGNLQELIKTMLMLKGVNAEVAGSFVQSVGAMRAFGTAAALTKEQAALANAGTFTLGDTAEKTGTRFSRAVGGLKGFGSAALGLVGGPIGLLVTAVGLLTLGFVTAGEAASAAGENIARAMQSGAEAGARAATTELGKLKVSLVDGLGIGEVDKTVAQLAREVNVPFEKLAAAVLKGKEAGKEVTKVLDEIAQKRGAIDYNSARSKGLFSTSELAKLEFIRKKVEEVGNKSSLSASDLETMDKATKALGGSTDKASASAGDLSVSVGDVGDEAKTASQKIDEFLDSIFGIANAEAAVQDSLSNLGESLAKSADVGTGTEGGRQNLKNFQDALRAALLQQQQLVDNSVISTEQASANYKAFVDGLVAKMTSMGVDPNQIKAVADQAKGYLTASFAGDPAKMPIDGDVSPVANRVRETVKLVNSYRGDIKVGVEDTNAQAHLEYLARNLSVITGQPYQVVLDALTDPANKNADKMQQYLIQIVNGTYKATVNADTSAAIANIQNFSNYARTELNSVQNLADSFVGVMGSLGIGGLDKIASGLIDKYGSQLGQQTTATPAPAQVQADPNTASSLDGLAQGYDKVANAAGGAGDAGKKAGEDMADGISDATRAADDFANRLKTGMTSAFDTQYGLQKATDDYYSALNAIKKKRDEELKQMDDLIQKQKDLNNERNGDLVNARKAGIEKNISLKYGEVDRAADYAQQEKEALDAAAAKQKDIQANNSQITSLKAGIGNLQGYSEAAIANRQALRDLESKMIDMISAYAATGKSQQQVAAYSAKLSAQFGRDVTQVGYNRNAVAALTGNMDRYRAAVLRIPAVKPTKVTADTDQAMRGIGGVSRALSALPSKKVVTTVLQYKGAIFDRGTKTKAGDKIYGVTDPATGRWNGTELFNKGGQVKGYASGGQIPGRAPSNPGIDNLMASVDGKGMVRVRSGEFIIQQPAVDYWGLDVMNALNNMKMPRFNSGGPVSGGSSSNSGSNGPMLVELTADNIRAILSLADRPVDLYANAEKIASTAGDGAVILASRGVL